MEEEIIAYLYNPTVGKIVTFFICFNLDFVESNSEKYLSKIKDNENRYKANKFGVFVGYVLSIILLTHVLVQTRNLTVAFGVAGAGIAFALRGNCLFAGWLAIMFGDFTTQEIEYNWEVSKVM
jgi:hypothetical protein